VDGRGPGPRRCPVLIVTALAVVAAAVFVALAALHVYWAFGGSAVGTAVIPTVDGRPTLKPSTASTLVVALLLAVSAVILIAAERGWNPTWLFRIGAAGIALVLLARAVGDFRTVGFFKRVHDTDFARNDTRYFSPVCLFLGITAAVVALTT
jgi:hypothetical protein